MCKCFKVSRSGYYKWLNSPASQRSKENLELTQHIQKLYIESDSSYGSPRMTMALLEQGVKVSRPRVARLMKKLAIRSRHKKKFRITTDSKHNFRLSPNLLKREFSVEETGKVWVSDITYIKIKEGWRYLTVVMDLADRQVIGWSIANSMHTGKTVIPAMKMAITNRRPKENMIFHSDRGVQYACTAFRSYLKSLKVVRQSMSRKANCWDNAVAESFFKSLKVEAIYGRPKLSKNQINATLFQYIELWYNRKRLHSALGYKTPKQKEYELNQLSIAA